MADPERQGELLRIWLGFDEEYHSLLDRHFIPVWEGQPFVGRVLDEEARDELMVARLKATNAKTAYLESL